MIKTKHSQAAHLIFKTYLKRLFRKHFHSLRLLCEIPEIADNHSVLVLANHSTWWDGFFFYLFNHYTFRRTPYVMMLESQLLENYFFRRVGAYSINPERALENLISLKYTVTLCHSPAHPVICIFPQGELLPWDADGLAYKRGIEILLKKINKPVHLCQTGFRCEFTEHQFPDVFIDLKTELLAPQRMPSLKKLENNHKDLLKKMQSKIRTGNYGRVLLQGKRSINEKYSDFRRKWKIR